MYKVLTLGIKVLYMDEIREFEIEFEKYTGAKHAIACSSGTSALHSAMIAVGLCDGV
jgi:perosamine synthetase